MLTNGKFLRSGMHTPLTPPYCRPNTVEMDLLKFTNTLIDMRKGRKLVSLNLHFCQLFYFLSSFLTVVITRGLGIK